MKRTLISLCVILFSVGLFAQQVDIVSQKIPTEASFAQPFDIRFELSHTPGYTVQLDPETTPANFTFTEQKEETLSPGTLAYDITVLPFSLGVSSFTAINFQLLDSQNNQVAQTQSEPVQITVKPVQFFKDKTLRDIRPPYIPFNWIWWFLCLLALFVLGYILRRFWLSTRQNQTNVVREIPDNRPPDVIALSKIQFLLQSGLWEKKEYKLFYIELGNILREYFWKRFHLDVSSDTSAELLRRARNTPQLAPLIQLLRAYLNSADLVKFAKVIPTQTTLQQDVSTVTTIIRQTTPTPTGTQEGS